MMNCSFLSPQILFLFRPSVPVFDSSPYDTHHTRPTHTTSLIVDLLVDYILAYSI